MLRRFVTQRRLDEGLLNTTRSPMVYCGCCCFYLVVASVGAIPLLAKAKQAAFDEASEVVWELDCFDEQRAPKGYIQHLSDCPVADHKVGSFKLTNATATKYLNRPGFSGRVSILGDMSSGEVKPWKSHYEVSILLADKGNVPADKMIMRGRRPYSLGSVLQNMLISFVFTLMFGSCYFFPDKSIARRMTLVPVGWFCVEFLLGFVGIPSSNLLDDVVIVAVVIAVLYSDQEEGYKILAITGAACGACLLISLLAYMFSLQEGCAYWLLLIGVVAVLWFIPPEFFEQLDQLWYRVSSQTIARFAENTASESAMASAPEPLLGNRYEETSASVGAHESAAQASSAEQGLATPGTITTTSTDNSHLYHSIVTGIFMGAGASVVLICVLAFVMVFISQE